MRPALLLLMAATFVCAAEVTVPPVDLGVTGIGQPVSRSVLLNPSGINSNSQVSLLSGIDFQVSALGCGSGGCNVPVTFAPRYPGMRHDVLVVRDSGGALLARVLISGIGRGPQAAITPGYDNVVDLITPDRGPLDTPVFDSAGNGYAIDNLSNQVFRIDAVNQSLTLVAGQGGDQQGYDGDGGPATSALFRHPSGLALDWSGHLFIADSGNNVIRRVDLLTGIITTAAGNGILGNAGNGGPAINAELNNPNHLVGDRNGDLYFLQSSPQNLSDFFVWKIDAQTENLVVVAGTGIFGQTGEGGLAKKATIIPRALALDSSSNLYIASDETGSTPALIRVISNGIISRFAGADAGTSEDGHPALATHFARTTPIAIDAADNLYLCDQGVVRNLYLQGSIRKINTAAPHTVQTVLPGSASELLSFNIDPAGNFYVEAGNVYTQIVNRGSQLSFGYTGIGQISEPEMVTYSNVGNEDLSISGIAISAERPLEFSQRNNCAPVLHSGESCQITVSFAALAQGNQVGSLIILDNTAESPYDVDLIGTGISGQEAQLDLTSLQFGTQNGGSSSPSQVVTLSNRGIFALNIKSIVADNDSFLVSHNCGTMLAAGGSCAITVSFSPRTNGPVIGNLVVTDDATSQTQSVSLSGTGQNVTRALSLSTGSLDLGVIILPANEQSTPPARNSVTVTNTGQGNLSSIEAVFSGANADMFRQGAGCRDIVPPGGSCQLDVLFQANGAGRYTAILTIVSQAPENDNGPVAGSGQTIDLSAAALPRINLKDSGASYLRVAADFDGDGKADLAYWHPSDGVWHIEPSTNPSQPIVRQWGLRGDVPVPGDYDGDGKADLAVWRPATGIWYVLPSGDGQPLIQQWGLSGDVPLVADFDGDGRADYTVWRPSNGTWYMISTGDPGHPVVQQWGLAGDVPVPGDYDGDGQADFAVWRPVNGVWCILPSSNPTAPTFQQWGLPGDTPLPADYDGDGTSDFAVWRPFDGGWHVLPAKAPENAFTQPWGLTGDVPLTGDYDGDGRADFAVWRPSSAVWYVRPTAHPDVPLAKVWGNARNVIVPANSSKTFLDSAAAWMPDTGVWTWPADPAATRPRTQQWGLPGDVPLLGDFDGDGQDDLTVWRPSNGTWYVYSSINPSLSMTQQWGLPGDIPLIADFDGDRRADFVVWRRSTGTWFVRPSGNAEPITFQWGLPGDIPLSGDFDADGKSDFIVWRPSTATWYITLSGKLAAPITQQWGLPGDVPLPVRLYDNEPLSLVVWRAAEGQWYTFDQPNYVLIPGGGPGDIPLTIHQSFMPNQGDRVAIWNPLLGSLRLSLLHGFEFLDGVSDLQIGMPSDIPL